MTKINGREQVRADWAASGYGTVNKPLLNAAMDEFFRGRGMAPKPAHWRARGGMDFVRKGKGKTSNVQRPTSNVQ